MPPKEQLINILNKDFEELEPNEIRILKQHIRKKYNFHVSKKFTENETLNGYLILKLNNIQVLDNLVICSHPLNCDFGPFGGQKLRYPPTSVSSFSGLNVVKEESFTISGHITLPILTVFYLETSIDVICVSPNGNFLRISNKDFLFDI